ncbi:hypothetical protein cypCar_00024566, partial [Cyprinus carpio]
MEKRLHSLSLSLSLDYSRYFPHSIPDVTTYIRSRAKMVDSIPLNPEWKNSRKTAYYNAGRPARYQIEDESSNLDEMPLMMSEKAFENDESDYQTLPRARGFVLAVTMVREAVDEVRHCRRDKEMNSQLYSKLTVRGKVRVKSSDIQVGDLIIVEKDLFSINAYIYAQKPELDIHSFEGNFTRRTVEVVFNPDLNDEFGPVDVGLLDCLTKALFLAQVVLSVIMVALQGFLGPWFRNLFRFVVLFSYIIPISLRVNLDMGKSAYSWMIMKDKSIPGTVVRTSTIPEELGRLVSDKTGTLTQNEMVFKRLHLGTVSYGTDTMDEIQSHIIQSYAQ